MKSQKEEREKKRKDLRLRCMRNYISTWKICYLVVNRQSFLVIDGYLLNILCLLELICRVLRIIAKQIKGCPKECVFVLKVKERQKCVSNNRLKSLERRDSLQCLCLQNSGETIVELRLVREKRENIAKDKKVIPDPLFAWKFFINLKYLKKSEEGKYIPVVIEKLEIKTLV